MSISNLALRLFVLFITFSLVVQCADDDPLYTDNETIRFANIAVTNMSELAKKIDIEVPDGSKKGAGLTTERVLLALSSLMNEKHKCSAVCITSNPEKQLWIAHNESSDEFNGFMDNLRTLLLSDKLFPDDSSKEGVFNAILEYSGGRLDEAKDAKECKKIEGAHKKMRHWIHKLLSLRDYRTEHPKSECDLNFIYESLTTKSYHYVTQPELLNQLGSKKIYYHAEMQLLDKLEKEGLLNQQIFLAISRKCCLKCAAAIQALNESQKIKGRVKILVKESHFTLYDVIWRIPDFIINDKDGGNIFVNFIGEKSYGLYKESANKEELIRYLAEHTMALPGIKIKQPTDHSATKSDNDPSGSVVANPPQQQSKNRPNKRNSNIKSQTKKGKSKIKEEERISKKGKSKK